MDNKDFDSVIEWCKDVAGDLGSATLSFLEYLPDWIKGAIIVILIVVWLFKRIT